MNEQDKAYLAAIIDGCGYIHIRKYVTKAGKPRSGIAIYTLALSISHKDSRLVYWLVEAVGGGYVRKEEGTHRWILTGRKVGELLEKVRPFMVIKQEQADIAIAYTATIHTEPVVRPLDGPIRAQRSQWHQDLIALHGRGTIA